MAKIATITNPVTGQPAQVDQLDHTAQEIDDAIDRAKAGGAIDVDLSNKLGGIESTEYPGCYYRMVDGVVEWFNPPMQLGVEYRTTERYNERPVYVKAINFGTLPNKSTKTIEHGVSNIDEVVDGATGGAKSSTNSISFPSMSSATTWVSSGANLNSVWVATSYDASGYTTSHVIIRYTKTTD